MFKIDLDLWRKLHNWRVAEAITQYSEAHFISLGPALVMSDRVLDQIVHGVHDCKIKTLAELRRETHWEEVDGYGQAVVDIIARHLPPAAISDIGHAHTPFADRTTATVNTASAGPSTTSMSRSGQVQRCSVCGQSGHNSE